MKRSTDDKEDILWMDYQASKDRYQAEKMVRAAALISVGLGIINIAIVLAISMMILRGTV